jgi:hypothetical protein
MTCRFLVLAAALALVAGAASAQQQMPCGERDELLAQLESRYKEAPTGFGLTPNGAIVELLTSEKGSWTLLLTLPGGRSCLIGSGEGWELWGGKKVAGKDA